MLPLTILSACAAVLVLPASAAPLPVETSELRQPTGILATPPDQALAAGDQLASGAAPRGALRLPRGVGFREPDYAVNAATAATAFKTVVPAQGAQATPAVFTAAAPTRAVLSRRSGSSSDSGNKAQMDHDEVVAPVALAAAPSPAGGFHFAAAPGTDPLKLSQPAVDPLLKADGLSGFNKPLTAPLTTQPDTPTGAPGPEARPQLNKANRTLHQSQLDDAPTTPPQLGESRILGQVNAANAPVLTINQTGNALPQVNGPGAATNSASSTPAAVPHKIGTVAAEPHSHHDRRGPLRLSRYLSGSSLYPDSDLDQRINPRAAESLPVEEPAPRAALVKNSAADMDVKKRAASGPPALPLDATLPSVGAQRTQSPERQVNVAREQPDKAQGLDKQMQEAQKLVDETDGGLMVLGRAAE